MHSLILHTHHLQTVLKIWTLLIWVIFFNSLFQIALTIGAVIAVLIIAVSGLEYMTTEAASGKGSSRERIQQAVLGLLMLLSVWLFFNEINPDILNLDFTLGKGNIAETSVDYRDSITNAYQTESGDGIWILRGRTCESAQGVGWRPSVTSQVCGNLKPEPGRTLSDYQCCINKVTFPEGGEPEFFPDREARAADLSGKWCYRSLNPFGNVCFETQETCQNALPESASTSTCLSY